jgi:hypothetical protein
MRHGTEREDKKRDAKRDASVMKGVNSTFSDQKGAFFQSRMKSVAFG